MDWCGFNLIICAEFFSNRDVNHSFISSKTPVHACIDLFVDTKTGVLLVFSWFWWFSAKDLLFDWFLDEMVLPLFSFDKKITCFGLKTCPDFENNSGMLIRDFSRFEEWKWSLHTTTSLVHKNANMKCKVTIQGLREKGVRLLVDKDPHSPSVDLPFSKLRIS